MERATNSIHFVSFFSRSSRLYALFPSPLATLYVLVCFVCDIDTILVLYTTNKSKFHTLLSQVIRLLLVMDPVPYPNPLTFTTLEICGLTQRVVPGTPPVYPKQKPITLGFSKQPLIQEISRVCSSALAALVEGRGIIYSKRDKAPYNHKRIS